MRPAIVLALLLVGCGDPGAELDARRQPILNGVEDAGHPAVGLLRNIFCTATLVGSRTVLTAAHCLQQSGPYSIQLEDRVYDATKIVPHPDWRTEEGPLAELQNLDWKLSVNDIGVLLLDEPVVGVRPMRLATRTPSIGESATLVGFGVTADGSGGTKHKAENVVGCVGKAFVLFGTIAGLGGGTGLTCTGDSGGPVLVVEDGEERVLGVHSMAICGKYTQCTRVTPYLDWLASKADGDLGVAADPRLAPMQREPSFEETRVSQPLPADELVPETSGCSVNAPARLADRAALLLGMLALLVALVARCGRDLVP